MSRSINIGSVVAVIAACILTGCRQASTPERRARYGRGSFAGSSNQVEFYPDLGYVLVVLGNTESGTEAIAAHVRASLTSTSAS